MFFSEKPRFSQTSIDEVVNHLRRGTGSVIMGVDGVAIQESIYTREIIAAPTLVAQGGCVTVSLHVYKCTNTEYVSVLVTRAGSTPTAVILGDVATIDTSTLSNILGEHSVMIKANMEGMNIRWQEHHHTYANIVRTVEVAEGAPEVCRFTFIDGSVGYYIVHHLEPRQPMSMFRASKSTYSAEEDRRKSTSVDSSVLDGLVEQTRELKGMVDTLLQRVPKPKKVLMGYTLEETQSPLSGLRTAAVPMTNNDGVEMHIIGSKIYFRYPDGTWHYSTESAITLLESWSGARLNGDGLDSILEDGVFWFYGVAAHPIEGGRAKKILNEANLKMYEVKDSIYNSKYTISVSDYAYGTAIIAISTDTQHVMLACSSNRLRRNDMEFGKLAYTPKTSHIHGYAYNTTTKAVLEANVLPTDAVYDAVCQTVIEAPLKTVTHITSNQLVIERDFKLEIVPDALDVLELSGYSVRGTIYRFILSNGIKVYVGFDRRNTPNVLRLDSRTTRKVAKLSGRPTKDIMYKHCQRLAEYNTNNSGE